MDANQTQGGKELAERIQAVRGEPAHRYELHDPFAETTYRFPTAEAARAKADEMGATRFQHRDAEGGIKQVDKVDGQWWVRNEPTPPQNSQQPPAAADKPLASVQAEIDRDALRSIEIRAEQRAAVGQGLDANTDREMATVDAHAFRRIEDKGLQESAAVEMANNARQHPEYKTGLDNAIPGYPGTAEKVYALDAENDAKIAAKEDRKAADFAAMVEDRRERAAAWSPEEAASQAQRDAAEFRQETDKTEQHYKVSDMALNADANPHYREALEKAAPEVVTEIEARQDRDVLTADTWRNQPRLTPEEFAKEHNLSEADAEVIRKLDEQTAAYQAQATDYEARPSWLDGGKEAVELAREDAEILAQPPAPAEGYLVEPDEAPAGAEATQGKDVEVEPLTISQADLDRVAAARARDTAQARESLGLNTVEPNIEKEQQQLSEAQDAQRAAWLKKAEADAPKPQAGKAPGDNKVESDEIFTATQTEVKPAVPPDVEKQYLHVGNKFYHPKNTDLVAFEDKGNKLETKSNSEAIAESMVRIAEARGWDEIKVSGSETFRKEVWLEAASRGMHVKGYSPSEQDKAELAKRMSQTEANKVEKGDAPFRARETDAAKDTKAQPQQPEPPKPESPNKRMAESFAKDSPEEAAKKHPELAGAAAAVASMEKKAEADGLNAQQRAIVMARVRQNVVNSIERGHIPEVKVKEEMEVKREIKAEKEHAR